MNDYALLQLSRWPCEARRPATGDGYGGEAGPQAFTGEFRLTGSGRLSFSTGQKGTGGKMIKQLTGLPSGVIGFEVTGTVTAEDFRDVVLPAVETAARSGDVRFMIVIPEFRGMTPGALWEDLKVGMENFLKWKRIALVTDIEWMHHMTSLFGWMTPGEMKTFTAGERDQAIAWVSE